MNVILINESKKKALSLSRRILAQYLPNIGKNVYSGAITEKGLQALKAELNAVASKNTTVACYKITTRSRIELEWIVGSAEDYSENGEFMFRYTSKKFESFAIPEHLNDLKKFLTQLNVITGLVHDIGKGFYYFQNKLSLNPDDPNLKTTLHNADPIRHEKLSYDLFSPLFKGLSEKPFEEQIQTIIEQIANFDFLACYKVSKELQTKRGLFEAILQITLSHHRLIWNIDLANETYGRAYDAKQHTKLIEAYQQQSLLINDATYREKLQNSFQKLLEIYQDSQHQSYLERILAEPRTLDKLTQYLLRPAFILADQHFSSQNIQQERWNQHQTPYANLYTHQGNQYYNQTLEEHLLGVSKTANQTTRYLFQLAFGSQELAFSHLAYAPKKLLKRVPLALQHNFGWQNNAVDSITKIINPNSQNEMHYGFIGCLMAKTGAGKTIAAPKIMSAINQNQNLRFSCLLGLKSLTLQTYQEYQAFLKIDPEAIAGIIGSTHSRELFEQNQIHQKLNRPVGNLEQSVLEDAQHDEQQTELIYEQRLSEDLPKFLQFADNKFQPKLAKILDAPVLSCTIDYLISGINSTKSNASKYLLRIMSSDLIIDEIDNYQPQQLPSILRLVYLSGFYGRKVLVSSATISNRLAKELNDAYQTGYQLHCQIKQIPCRIYQGFYTHEPDLNRTVLQDEKADNSAFIDTFFENFKQLIQQNDRKRRLKILPLEQDFTLKQVYENVLEKAFALFEIFATPIEKTSFSTGLIKLANVQYIRELGAMILDGTFNDLIPENVLFKVEIYHSKNLEIKKAYQEHQLAQLLTRKNTKPLLKDTDCFQQLEQEAKQKNKTHIFVLVIASPIIETGRDFDFDWIINEPRDHRSLIQTFGRQYRHRNPPKHDGCYVLERSLKCFDIENQSNPYQYPGFCDGLGQKEDHYNEQTFTELFEFDENDFINAGIILDDESKNLAKGIEIKSFNKIIQHGEGFKKGFLQAPEITYSATQEKVLPFRESDPQNAEVQLTYSLGQLSLQPLENHLSAEALNITFDQQEPKHTDYLLIAKPLLDIIDFYYQGQTEHYFEQMRILRYRDKEGNQYNEYLGCL